LVLQGLFSLSLVRNGRPVISRRWTDSRAHLDFREHFLREGVVTIPQFLRPGFANRVSRDIFELGDRLWSRVTHNIQRSRRGDVDPYSKAGRRRYFSFSFDQYKSERPTTAGVASGSVSPANTAIDKLLVSLSGSGFEQLASSITKEDLSSNGTIATLTKYAPRDFLALHTDGVAGRKVAFVLNLTLFWLPHWGGHLVILNLPKAASHIAIIPQFNSLTLFRTPRPHMVTAVAERCTAARFAISGWLY
jgi:hypothetical protein